MPGYRDEGLEGWIRRWQSDASADPRAARVLIDAMASYTLEMRRLGKSARVLDGIYSDLDAAGLLVFSYWAPKAKNVLSFFADPPCEIEFRRKLSDSEWAMARYRRSLGGFRDFLVREGILPGEDP